jgi:drug/metabolite transporter (DMT)-like permease
MKREAVIEHLMPWAGVVLAGVAWFTAHQVGSDSVFDNCEAGNPLFNAVVNLIGLALAVLGGVYGRRIWRRGEDETEGRRFLGLLGMLFAMLLSFALVLQLVAGFIVPRCLS